MFLDLHSHSVSSDDSRATVEQYLKWIHVLRKRGFQADGIVLTEHRKFDPKDIIEKIDSIGLAKTTKLFWLVATAGGETSSQGDYSLSSLPSLLNKLKKDPPKI